ncbi:MAG TPA: STN domain-containing protein [Steroidobacteraceae bacterium]|nr:STN domain-containing protein [Steroidobacteraceae bacterium]
MALIRLTAADVGWPLIGLIVLGLFVGRSALGAPKLQTFHIEAGEASLTLNEFSRQSSLQLLFDYNIVRGRRTRAISGEYAAPAALAKMLADTGLVFDFVNDRTLAVTLVTHETDPGSAVAEAPNSNNGRVRSAQIRAQRNGESARRPAASERIPAADIGAQHQPFLRQSGRRYRSRHH